MPSGCDGVEQKIWIAVMGKSRSPDLEAVLCDVCVQLAAPLFCEVSPEMINEYSVT